MLPPPSKNSRNQQKRPRSRTLTAVHESILSDLVYPSEITGKRTRVNTDGSKVTKVFLDAKDSNLLEYKLETFSSTYRKLTGKDVHLCVVPLILPAHLLPWSLTRLPAPPPLISEFPAAAQE
jgi:small subunit ribosomal protein S7e